MHNMYHAIKTPLSKWAKGHHSSFIHSIGCMKRYNSTRKYISKQEIELNVNVYKEDQTQETPILMLKKIKINT